jgi:hypothetical protein
MELRFVDEYLLPVESWKFLVEYSDTADDDRLIRTLLLTPGSIGIAGFHANGEKTITLEQIVATESD